MIKRYPADIAFSDCVRERVNYHCESCGKYFKEGKRRGLHCSHYVGRGNWATRFDPLNVFSHCYNCHIQFQSDPYEFYTWVLKQIGEGAHTLLIEKKGDKGIKKLILKENKRGDIAKHYREELIKIRECRSNGEKGRIEFLGWS